MWSIFQIRHFILIINFMQQIVGNGHEIRLKCNKMPVFLSNVEAFNAKLPKINYCRGLVFWFFFIISNWIFMCSEVWCRVCAPWSLFVPYFYHRFNLFAIPHVIYYYIHRCMQLAKWMPNDMSVCVYLLCVYQTWKTLCLCEKHAIECCTTCINYEAQMKMIDCM